MFNGDQDPREGPDQRRAWHRIVLDGRRSPSTRTSTPPRPPGRSSRRFVCGLSCLTSFGVGGGERWAASRASTDTRRFQEVTVPGVAYTLGTNQRHHGGRPEETPPFSGGGCVTSEQKQMGFVWGDFFLLTGTNVFCEPFCVSTVCSFCMQANFIHWKTTKDVSLYVATNVPLFPRCLFNIQR